MNKLFKITTLLLFTFFFSTVTSAQVQRVKMNAVEKIISEKGDKILVLNVWATFCKPCVAEIPSFVKFANAHDDVQLVFLSLDIKEAFPKTILKYNKQLGMEPATNLWLDETDADYFVPKIDEKWSGAIPATLIINSATGVRKFVDGELSEKELLEAYEFVKSSK